MANMSSRRGAGLTDQPSRDPGVQALWCIEVSAEELEAMLLHRQTWPVVRIRGCYVGLAVDGFVVGEARIGEVYFDGAAVAWPLLDLRRYRNQQPAPAFGRAQARPMPTMPVGAGPKVDREPMW